MTKSLWSLLVEVIIFRVTQSLKSQDGGCWRQPLRNHYPPWQAVKQGKGSAFKREKEPEHAVNIRCHDGGPERVEGPQQFGRSDTVRINVA